MKAEHLTDAIGRLDEAMVAEGLPRRRRNLRPLMVAAAIAAALAVTAGAVSVLAPQLFYYEDPEDGTQFAARMYYGGTDFSQELLEEFVAAEEAYRAGLEEEFPVFRFPSFSDMEAYLGVDLLETSYKPVEDCYFDTTFFYIPEIREQDLRLFLHYTPHELDRDGPVEIPKLNIQVFAYLAADDQAVLTCYTSAKEGIITTAYEIESLGVTASIAKSPGDAEAWFVKDGVGYNVWVQGIGIDFLCAILESFQY